MTRPGLRTDLRQVPHGRTAHRLSWEFLPPKLRGVIERHLGSRVVDARSCDAGFTPGFASVLTGEGDRALFVKAASKQAQAVAARSYLDEARKIAALPAGVPAPELLWVHEDELWVAVGLRVVPGRPPRRPWVPDELDRALDVAEAVADATDPVPPGTTLSPLLEEVPGLGLAWDRLPERPHREEAVALGHAYRELPMDAFCHSDLRDDNILLADDPGAPGARDVAVDWNWSALAPRWQDTVDLLVSAYGDGIDVEPIVAERRLTRDVDPEHIDCWLSALGGFMEESSHRRPPTNSPHLRTHSRWYAEALWGWLCDRRGWE